jgi:acyl dehydratase
MQTIDGVDQLLGAVGLDLGTTEWLPVTQADVDAFAAATRDFQWIHVDPVRARASPFGTTIAHGLYTLSLGPLFTAQLLEITNMGHTLNYGYGRIRFPAPLVVGSRLRMHATLTEAHPVPGGAQFTVKQTFEREGGDKPVCVAEAIGRAYITEGNT